MAYLKLIREKPDGIAVCGKLYLATYNLIEEREELHLICPTLENRQYLIPPLIYRLTVTWSPKFKRLLPLVSQVEGRSGIRFHVGTKPEHSRGCILVRDRKTEDALRELIMSAQSSSSEQIVRRKEREVRLDIQ